MVKPFSQACENNQEPILAILREAFVSRKKILEIGSGTGQHSVYFAPRLPHLVWQTSDMPVNHRGIHQWIDEYSSDNLRKPLSFTIRQDTFPCQVDGVFTANTAHIMLPDRVQLMMQLVAQHLPHGGVFCQYGPFNVDGRFTSDSNATFDAALRGQGMGGIRDIAELISWAEPYGLNLQKRHGMPANNMLIEWHKS